jgi:hypothetical protein
MSTPHTPPKVGDDGAFPLSEALRAALIAADAEHRASLEALRAAVCAYVEDLRGQGVSAAEIVRSVRGRVAVLRTAGRMAAPVAPGDALLDQIVAWCLEAGAGAP